MIEFHTFIREAISDGHCEYAASVDIDSAFDTVTHELLVKTEEDRRVYPYICRYIYAWRMRRLFAVRLRTHAGW